MLDLSYPVSWLFTVLGHFICWTLVKKRVNRQMTPAPALAAGTDRAEEEILPAQGEKTETQETPDPDDPAGQTGV